MVSIDHDRSVFARGGSSGFVGLLAQRVLTADTMEATSDRRDWCSDFLSLFKAAPVGARWFAVLITDTALRAGRAAGAGPSARRSTGGGPRSGRNADLTLRDAPCMASDPFSAPVKHFVWCSYCEKAVNATEGGSLSGYDGEHGPPWKATLTRCDVCSQALLFFQEDYGDGWDEMARVWPDGVRPLSASIPESLRAEHYEARKCFDAKAFTATVVMVRRTLEGVCADKGARERNLAASLKVMHEEGLLDNRLYEWAQQLRIVGNEGAHFTGNQVPRQDAADALAFCEAFLDYLYVLTAKFEEFRQRRATKESAAPADG